MHFENLKEPIELTVSVAFALYVGISSFTLLDLQDDNPNRIFKDCRFWIGAGLLIYSAGGLANFAFHDIILEEWIIAIPIIHRILNLIMHILYSIGFLCQSR